MINFNNNILSGSCKKNASNSESLIFGVICRAEICIHAFKCSTSKHVEITKKNNNLKKFDRSTWSIFE